MRVPTDRLRVLEVTSTWRASPNDVQPGFVSELCDRLSCCFDVVAVVPSRAEIDQPGAGTVVVKPFRYSLRRLERLGRAGGLLQSVRRYPWLSFLVPVYFLSMVVSVLREIRTSKFDVVHAHWWFPCGLAALIARKISGRRTPIVITCHGADIYALRGRLFGWLRRQVLRRADKVIAVSRTMQRDLEWVVGGDRLFYGPMGVELQCQFTFVARAERDIDVLFVGRLVEKKGAVILLDALLDLASGSTWVRVVIVGDGPLADELKLRARLLPTNIQVDFVGALPKEKIPEMYQRARLTVFPSITAKDGDQEGLGLVPIEAMGCGSIVLASDIEVLRETIIPGENGFLFSEGDSLALATCLRELLFSERSDLEAIRVAARASVLRDYDWSVAVKRYGSYLGDGVVVEEDLGG